MYVMLEPFDRRRGSELYADAIGKSIQDRCHLEVRGAIVSAFGAPPVDGLGTTGGFNLIIEDRGNSGLEDLEHVTDRIVAQGKKDDQLRDLFNTSGSNTPWLYLQRLLSPGRQGVF